MIRFCYVHQIGWFMHDRDDTCRDYAVVSNEADICPQCGGHTGSCHAQPPGAGRMRRPDGWWCDFCPAFVSKLYRYVDRVRLGGWDLCRGCFDRHHAKDMRLAFEAYLRRKAGRRAA